MDWPDMLVGAALTLLGWTLGRITLPKKKTFEDPKPICGCEHHYSFHGDGGSCTAQFTKYVAGYQKLLQCTCKKYSGPLPLESYTAES